MVAKLAMGWLVGMLAAQDPEPAPTLPVDSGATPSRVEIVMRCEALGRREPRFGEVAAGTAAAFRWVGRKWSYVVDGKSLTASLDVAVALGRILNDHRAAQIARGDRYGFANLPILHVEPGDSACWGEIVGVCDLAASAGFQTVTIDQVDSPVRRIAEVSDASLAADDELIVPQAQVSAERGNVESSGVVIEVRQDGRAGDPGHVLFTPSVGKADDLTRLREFLLSARASLQRQGHLVARPGKTEPWLDVALVVRADRWTDWRDVRRMLALATTPEIGFWNVGFVASHRDLESELRREREKR